MPPRRPPSQPRQSLFAPGEVEALRCPCGQPVVAAEPIENPYGDLVQFGFCPVCSPAEPNPRLWLPQAAARKFFH